MNTPLRLRSLVVALIVGSFGVAGCGSTAPSSITPASTPASAAPQSPSTASSPSVPSGPAASTAPASAGSGAGLPTTGRIAVTDKGYAITLPPAWTRVDLGPEGFNDLLEAGGSALPPSMQDLLKGQVGQMAASGVSLFAFRQPEGALAAGTTLNVLSLPNLGIQLDTLESLVVGQLKGVLGQDTEITTARVQGPAGEFLRLTYVLKAGPASVGTVQYLFVTPSSQLVISCGTPGAIESVQAECESIAKTLEIL
jgi:hypothetical protein